jgi:hypothetical protein
MMSVNYNLTRAFVAGLIVAAPMVASAVAETTGADANPYAVISDKNVFHLNPPPPPVSAESTKPPDLQKVMLSGFQKVGNRMKVYLAIPAKDPKDTAYLALQAGEKANDVEIVKIRVEKQEVDIINTGTAMTLTIASNGFAVTGGGVAAKTGGGPGPGMPGNHHMPGMPGAFPPSMPAAAVPSPASVSSGGSAIIVGGGEGSSGGSGSFGSSAVASSSYGGGAIVSGGQSSYGNTAAAAPNSPASQIANTLFSGGQSQPYRMPTQDNIAPAPPEVQAAGLLLNQAAHGPPAPSGLEPSQ